MIANIFLISIIVVALVLFSRDRYNHRRALKVETSWTCFRCGVELGPMQSVFIKVAGATAGTKARVCERCAKRDVHIWWTIAAALGMLFVITVFFCLPKIR